MCGNDDCFTFFTEFFEKEYDFTRIFWVQIPCRLIADDDIGIMDESSCYSSTLEFSSRKCFYEFIFFGEHADMREYLGYAF